MHIPHHQPNQTASKNCEKQHRAEQTKGTAALHTSEDENDALRARVASLESDLMEERAVAEQVLAKEKNITELLKNEVFDLMIKNQEEKQENGALRRENGELQEKVGNLESRVGDLVERLEVEVEETESMRDDDGEYEYLVHQSQNETIPDTPAIDPREEEFRTVGARRPGILNREIRDLLRRVQKQAVMANKRGRPPAYNLPSQLMTPAHQIRSGLGMMHAEEVQRSEAEGNGDVQGWLQGTHSRSPSAAGTPQPFLVSTEDREHDIQALANLSATKRKHSFRSNQSAKRARIDRKEEVKTEPTFQLKIEPTSFTWSPLVGLPRYLADLNRSTAGEEILVEGEARTDEHGDDGVKIKMEDMVFIKQEY